MEQQDHTDNCNVPDTNLTRSQLLIWTGQQLNPEAPLYNMAMAFELKGQIDITHFHRAFQKLVDSSDALRTVFYTQEGIPRQRVLAAYAVQPETIDWLQESAKEHELQDWLKKRSKRNFDVSQPLFDSALIKLAKDHFVWFFNQHHLITDGWSVTLLYRKMTRLYGLSLAEELNEAKPLPAFSDYRDLELKLRSSTSRDQVDNHWQRKINQLPPAPVLYGREATSGSNSERNHINLGRELSEKLRALTQENDLRGWTQDLSLFNIFATVLIAYLNRVSGQQRLAIGTPAHNRIKPVYKETPGLFIELFPVSVEVEEGECFNTLFKKVQTEAFDFLKYAQPGAASPELSRSFNVVLNYINARLSDFNGIPVKSDWVHPDHADAAHVLRLQVHDFDDSGSIQLHFDLNTTVFDKPIREAIPGHFLKLLNAFVADRTQAIGQPALQEESAALFGAVAENVPANIIDLFESREKEESHAPAIEYQGQLISYYALNGKANQLAHYLLKSGVGQGDRVALYLKRSPEFLISILAVLKTGASYVPIDTNYSGARSARILEDAKAALLISNTSLKGAFAKAPRKVIYLDELKEALEQEEITNLNITPDPDHIAYIMYTSGSTGVPKGVMISHANLSHYIGWAQMKYQADGTLSAPLFTATGFDLTVTSIFLPITSGGKVVVYPEPDEGPDLSIFDVMDENKVSFIKLTPSHLALIKDKGYPQSAITTMVVGGEELKHQLARTIHQHVGTGLDIFNEYGPTEATVGCVVHQFDPQSEEAVAIPIGSPIDNTSVYILDEHLNAVPDGVTGELYVSGNGLATGYWQLPELTKAAFIDNPFKSGQRLYKTGDLVRLNASGILEYRGRIDEQVKISGRRIEPGEIEYALSRLEGVNDCTVQLRTKTKVKQENEVINCAKCGLPSNYPQVDFNEEHICDLCLSFEDYQNRVQKYFKNSHDLKALFDKTSNLENKSYDCIALLSGGKDSTYALARLVEMDLKVLAFTLDNGYISEQAKDNIRRVVTDLGVDHMFGTTPAMNEIFVDSLKTHRNVCDGCFKTIYTLSMKVALEKNIPYIVTGLSRGQFFETRLTEELFRDEKADLSKIDEIILEARKSYHRVDDAVKRLLDVSAFDDDVVFEKVKFIDFYRYTDVSLDEMLQFLDEKISWVRPTDTGRSTNCLINQAGIFVHKKERGYSNYAFPYSWDVRLGHKTRDASLEEINEEIDEQEVSRILDEIGYTAAEEQETTAQLVAYYTGEHELEDALIRRHLESLLPDYMVPVQFIHLNKMPLNENGKTDKQALPLPDTIRPVTAVGYVAPRTDIEEALADIWSEVLNIDKVGVYDKFLELGGTSLAAIRVISRANEAFELDLPLNLAFNKPTIAAFAEYVRETIMKLLEEMDSEQHTMAKILCMTTGLTGILNASFELIKRLEAMGHEVIAASPASVEEKVAMQGLNYLQLSPVNFDPAPAIPSYSGKLRKVKRFWYKLRCAGKRRKAAVAALGMEQFLEKVADVAPDLVIIDIELHERIMALYTANYKVLLLSQWFSTWDSKGLPPIQSAIMPGRGFAGSSLGLRLAWTKVRITRWYTFLKKKFLTVYTDRRSILQLYAKESGFPTRLIKKNYWPGPFSYAELPVISMTAKDLDFEHEVRPGLTYVGPMVSAQRKEAVNDQESEQQLQVIFKKKENEGKKLIYCSVSTFSQADTSFLKKVTQAFSGMSDWLLIISLGGKATTDSLGEVSENVFVFSRVPQLQVLARADLSINHGGIHTINECLHFGVPMLIYSGKRSDQNGCAARVNYHGVGLMADKDRDRPEDIKRKINELLHATDVSVRLDELMGSNKNRQVDLESVLNGLKIKPSCINTP